MPAQIQFQPVDWRPDGSLAAVYDAHARNQMDWANQHELENARLANIIKERDAAIAQDEMNSPEYRDWRLRGMMGKDQSSAATGAYDQAVLPGKIDVTKAEQRGKLDLQQMENEATKLERLQQVLSQRNPLAVQQAMAMMDDDEDRAQLQEMLMDPAYGHQGVLDFLQSQSEQLRDTLARNATRGARMTEAAKHGNAMELEGLKGRNTLQNTREMVQGRKDTEEMGIEAGKYAKVLKDRFSLLTKTRPDLALAQIRAGLVTDTDPISGQPLSEESLKYWNEYAETLAKIMNAKNQATTTNKADISQLGINPTSPPQVPGAITQQATGSTSQVRKWNPTIKKWE